MDSNNIGSPGRVLDEDQVADIAGGNLCDPDKIIDFTRSLKESYDNLVDFTSYVFERVLGK